MNEPTNINVPSNCDNGTFIINFNDLKKDIYDNILYNHLKSEFKQLLYWKNKWVQISLFFTVLKYVCLVAVPILSLSSPQPFFQERNLSNILSYTSGAISSLALGFERLSKLCKNISDNKNKKINEMLEQTGMGIKMKNIECQTEYDYPVRQNSGGLKTPRSD